MTSTEAAEAMKPRKPRPGAMIASARRMTTATVSRVGYSSGKKGGKGREWQADGWDMFDLVGEVAYLANTLANRVSQARLYVGMLSDEPDAPPIPVDRTVPEPGERDENDPTVDAPPAARTALDSFGVSPSDRGQMLHRYAVNVFVAGEGYLLGVPSHYVTGDEPMRAPEPSQGIMPGGQGAQDDEGDASIYLDDLRWVFASMEEVSFEEGSGERPARVTAVMPSAKNGAISDVPVTDVIVIHVMKPHPRNATQPTSPTRSNLPVLRELVGLTMHVSAQVDSRLAGAGLLAVRQSVIDAMEQSDQPDEAGGEEQPGGFMDLLMEAMIKPVGDRSTAAALVPFLVGVPDDGQGTAVSDHFHYQSFATPLDEKAGDLRDESLRRAALGLDAPPELLLGTGGMNHWGAWLVKEETVTAHVEPPLALFCDALTSEFLWPVLEAEGVPPEEARRYVVWYDVEHLIARPNRTEEAFGLFDRGAISADALRSEAGYPNTAAPAVVQDETDPAVVMALELVESQPTLMSTVGLPALVQQIRAVLAGEEDDAPAPEPEADDAPAEDTGPPEDDAPTDGDGGGTPDTSQAPADPPGFGSNSHRSRLAADLATLRRSERRTAPAPVGGA